MGNIGTLTSHTLGPASRKPSLGSVLCPQFSDVLHAVMRSYMRMWAEDLGVAAGCPGPKNSFLRGHLWLCMEFEVWGLWAASWMQNGFSSFRSRIRRAISCMRIVYIPCVLSFLRRPGPSSARRVFVGETGASPFKGILFWEFIQT